MPNNHDGISVISFSSPEMCNGVNNYAPAFFNRSDNARTNCILTNKILDIKCLTHPTVVYLLLNNVMYSARNCGHTSSITIYNINNPDIYKPEFVNVALAEQLFSHNLYEKGETPLGCILLRCLLICLQLYGYGHT